MLRLISPSSHEAIAASSICSHSFLHSFLYFTPLKIVHSFWYLDTLAFLQSFANYSSLKMFLQTVSVITLLHFMISTLCLTRIWVQVLTALSFTALVAALPFSTDIVPSLQNLQARANPDVYKLYLGDGSTKEGWPSKAQWYALLDTFPF